LREFAGISYGKQGNNPALKHIVSIYNRRAKRAGLEDTNRESQNMKTLFLSVMDFVLRIENGPASAVQGIRI